jgi:hypothetical protein
MREEEEEEKKKSREGEGRREERLGKRNIKKIRKDLGTRGGSDGAIAVRSLESLRKVVLRR